MRDSDKIKLLNAGFKILKITGVPAKQIRDLYNDEKYGLCWTVYHNGKTVGGTKELFEDRMKNPLYIDGAGL